MSGYPYGYPYQGQPPPSQPQYPSYQPYGAYPPANGFSTTPPQAQQQQQQQQQQQNYAPPTTGYYTTAQSAYDYNASSIPGLGSPASGPPPFAVPYNGGWQQGNYGNSAHQLPYNAYVPSAPPSSAPTVYPYSQAQAPVPRVPPPAATPIHASQTKLQSENAPKHPTKAQAVVQPKPQDGHAEVQEEGEIDDGYFDDLYDDASKAPSVTNETMAIVTKASEELVEVNSDQEPNFYDTDMEDVPVTQKPSATKIGEKMQDSIKGKGPPDRDRSRSYSPHLSPIEIRRSSSSLHEAALHGIVGDGTREQVSATVIAAAPSSNSAQDGASGVKNGENAEAPAAAVTGPILGTTPSRSFTSVFEASNEAKKAILRLLPHGVKYQTYIDEGFEAEFVKDLFMQLNLPTDSASSAPPEKTAAAQEKGALPPSNQPSQQTSTDTMAKKQEERKDKIARLMAEKKAKLAAASKNTGADAGPKGGESPASAVSAPLVKPPITRAEKDRLLQQKVEALRNKAREAKKLAQKSVPEKASKPDAAQKPTPQQASPTTTQIPVAPQSTSGTPLSSASQSAFPSPSVSTLSSVPRAPPIIQRKRPVAADFMDYTPIVPVKRPSLANRQNSSLVISISDDEDDDDVEMEVESVTEDSPASLPHSLTLPRRGPSIRDFPPLSNIKNTRQVHSPVAGSSVSGTKNANADLETKERAILEMQRKIKELEAKKEAKARSGNVTPRSPSVGGIALPEQAVQTPIQRVVSIADADDKTTPSAQLLQEAEAARSSIPKLAMSNSQTQNGRRVTTPSAQLSGKSAKALEKAERLRRMQEEMQRLQAEIEEEDSMEEQGLSEEHETPAKSGKTQVSQGPIASTGHKSDSEADAKHAESSSAATSEEGQTAPNRVSPEAQPMQIDSSPDLSDSSIDTTAPSHATILMDQPTNHASTPSDTWKLPGAPGTTKSPPPHGEFAAADLGESDGYEPPDPKIDGRVVADSPTFSPQPAEVAHSAAQQRGEVVDTAREALNDTTATRQASFAPYESPLRYYHAYRFHPNYNNGIQGGLKSLTYSNRIDPYKEMCPDEWEGNDCPRGDACQFQHFQSIIAPDSEIILELGSSDEFTGDQKREFNNGLREVVASFQKSKVRDFRTIAQAIVDFRHRFLGDPSKILRLEGVTL